ncbi:hypothetical protein CYMTET_13477 [Cymbomonas tetramitiformis]|uniref:Reverse transcriptase domain-containing protein n=1 Tax=Cymbomonas tetramitiformis TaxID=36881 RepID=A0AAE0LAU8_9CHLO|nr:hypothetical protein CYMTET_13477 [Cymbomonas tetramitiformis]
MRARQLWSKCARCDRQRPPPVEDNAGAAGAQQYSVKEKGALTARACNCGTGGDSGGGAACGETEQTKQTAAHATPPDEEDAEEVPQWIWDELTELKKVFADVVGMELPKDVVDREHKSPLRVDPEYRDGARHKRCYKLSMEELRQLRGQLDELLAKGYIRPSSSPGGNPVLMVPKPSNPKELRLVIDYRQISEITVKDRYHLPDVQSFIDDLQGATIFSTADALWGFWQVPMEEEAIEKTAMTTPFGAYEWLVMPMGLSNSPSCW